jgi:uncharacterized protein
MRAVVDTNVLVSALIRPRATLGRILSALRDGRFVVVLSPPMLEELIDVLARPLLVEKYGVDEETVETFLRLLVLRSDLVIPQIAVRRCRDSKNDMFLEAAVAGAAHRLVSGDADLLALEREGECEIVTPRVFVDELD